MPEKTIKEIIEEYNKNKRKKDEEYFNTFNEEEDTQYCIHDYIRVALNDHFPCVKICKLGTDGYCVGCFRNIDEIRLWHTLTNVERQNTMYILERRKHEKTKETEECVCPVYEGHSIQTKDDQI